MCCAAMGDVAAKLRARPARRSRIMVGDVGDEGFAESTPTVVILASEEVTCHSRERSESRICLLLPPGSPNRHASLGTGWTRMARMDTNRTDVIPAASPGSE